MLNGKMKTKKPSFFSKYSNFKKIIIPITSEHIWKKVRKNNLFSKNGSLFATSFLRKNKKY
jgi:hypothetical protein